MNTFRVQTMKRIGRPGVLFLAAVSACGARTGLADLDATPVVVPTDASRSDLSVTDASRSDVSVPARSLVPLHDAARLVNAWAYFGVLDRAGSVFMWGLLPYPESLFHPNPQTGPDLTAPFASSARRVAMPERATDLCGINGTMCAQTASGLVYCMGWNDFGQLGDDSRVGQGELRVVPGLMGVREFLCPGSNADFMCIRKQNHETWCWGRGTFMALGGGATDTDYLVPVRVPALDSIKALSAAVSDAALNQSLLAIQADGHTLIWGDAVPETFTGDVFTLTTPQQVPNVGRADLVAIGEARLSGCIATSEGRITCWGVFANHANHPGTADRQVVEMDGVRSLIDRNTSVCGIDRQSVLRCWDITNEVVRPDLQLPVLSDVASIAGEAGTTCVLFNDGSVQCMGQNDSGQLGRGLAYDYLSNVFALDLVMTDSN